MFESNMLDNMQGMKDNVPEWRNKWRDLVTDEFKVFLDSLSTSKQYTTEKEEDL